MVGGVDGLQLDSSSHALRRSARRHFCLGPVFFIIAPSSGKMAGALWPKPQRRWQTVGKSAAFDRPSASAATPKIPPGGTACSAPFAPALSTSSRLPSESSPTTEKMRAKKLVALGVPACEFWRRPAASWNVGIHRCLCSLHRDGAGTRSRGRLRYMGAAPLPIFRATAETRVDRIHQRVVATAMQIFIVTVVAVFVAQRRGRHAELEGGLEVFEYLAPIGIFLGAATMAFVHDDEVEE